MLTLLAGLVLFLGAHSARIVAPGWRAQAMTDVGEKRWKGVVALVSLAGFVLIVVGFGIARRTPSDLWPMAPVWTHHLAALLTLIAFVLVAAAYVPRNHLKAALRDPMVLGVAVWAFAHLLANNTIADVVLFGAFFAWSVLDFLAARKRERLAAPAMAQATAGGTTLTVVVGALGWAVFAFWLHRVLIGVQPLGMGF